MFYSISQGKKAYEKVIDQLLELIKCGELKKGDKLPPERTLCEQLGIGRTTLKQALSSLSAMGIIESRHGGGNYISNSENVDLVIPFSAQFFWSGCKVNDLVQIRYIIESQIVRIVACKITDDQLAVLSEIVERMGKLTGDAARVSTNYEFHKFLVDLVKNDFLSSVYENISVLIHHQVEKADGINFYQNHLDLLKALQNHDPDMCSRLMKTHFEDKYPELRENFFVYFE